ncbi:MAG: type II toxin-antitoxin system VapC family toxin [Spirochaetales bacterium]|nr:type II toxin-antitoxin system VapC family toxin [Spirochaetales bacterium]
MLACKSIDKLHCTIFFMKQKSVIIDASAIMAVLLKEDEAMNVLQKTKGSVLLSAKCLPYEIANSLSRQLKRELVALEQARKIFSIFNRLPIELVDFDNALEFCAEEKHHACDMFYLDCAVKNKCPLLTLDKNGRTGFDQ